MSKETNVKVTTDLDPMDFKGNDQNPLHGRVLVNADVAEGTIPGFDEFSVTTEMLEGCKAARTGQAIGPVYWNERLGFHTDTHVFYWPSNHNLPQHARMDQMLVKQHTHKASLVVDAHGGAVTNQDHVLAVYPISIWEEKEAAADRKRIDDEKAHEDGFDVPNTINPERVKRQSLEQAAIMRQQMREPYQEYHSPTQGRSLQEVYDSKGATPRDQMIRVRMEEISERRGGAKSGNPADLRAEAIAELTYIKERRDRGDNARNLWDIKADIYDRLKSANEGRNGRSISLSDSGFARNPNSPLAQAQRRSAGR